MPIKNLHPRRYPTRRWEAVKIWKTNAIHSNIVIHRHERDGFTAVVWYVITNLPPTEHCCVIYACRWWQKCGFKMMKSAVFDMGAKPCSPGRTYWSSVNWYCMCHMGVMDAGTLSRTASNAQAYDRWSTTTTDSAHSDWDTRLSWCMHTTTIKSTARDSAITGFGIRTCVRSWKITHVMQ